MTRRTIHMGALLLVATGSMLAQPGFGPRNSGGAVQDPATRIAEQIARLTTLLDLTSSQATQGSAILTAAQTAISALQTTLTADQTALQAAIATNAVSTITQQATAIGTINGEILAIRSKAEASFYLLLTATQQAKVTTLGGPGILGFGPGGGGFGGPGGRGPRP